MKHQILTGMKFMQRAVFALILSLFFFSCTNEPVLPTADEAQAAIWEKIEAANDRWASGDPMGFLDCAAQDIIWIDDLGAQIPVKGKESLGKYLENFKGQIPTHKHELLDPEFQFYGEIVIVNYRYLGTIDEVPGEPWKITSVYRYINGDWLSVHENWSEVKQPPQP